MRGTALRAMAKADVTRRPHEPAHRPPVRGESIHTHLGALQRTAGNAAVRRLVAGQQVQRHPDHFPDPDEVQRQPAAQRITLDPRKRAKKKLDKVIAEEQRLSQKYGVQFGPTKDKDGAYDGEHFAMNIMQALERVLDSLPPGHVNLTTVTSIRPPKAADEGMGACSFFDNGSNQLTIVGPVPSSIYPLLDKKWAFQRYLMDAGAKAAFMGPGGFTTADVLNPKRKVMGGGTGGDLKENLLDWTIRHETGHAVDKRIGWTAHKAHEARFGGWIEHRKPADHWPVAEALLDKAGITGRDAITFSGTGASLQQNLERWVKEEGPLRKGRDVGPAALQAKGGLHKDNAATAAKRWQELVAHDPDFPKKWARFVKIVDKGRSQPWADPDGGAALLESGGRVFHMDHYKHWVSYLKAERTKQSLSRYMFSTPSEYFAEVYAAFYSPRSQAQLTKEVRTFFADKLGERGSGKDAELYRPQGDVLKGAATAWLAPPRPATLPPDKLATAVAQGQDVQALQPTAMALKQLATAIKAPTDG